ncbi:hypothetical protein PC116_g24772 [Phytophthora cactorum]|uniref:Uncharacterized protein n=1 Tax=Phytophthora cactorum TaxID=29920 RepID=A0A8T1JV46_9STRA|nr:hypothetical protein Pcac1_g28185 [Phytophthora cactorum]KAG2949597.1 hypothetical protein PC117_g5094 [Phytophthora cactorum]KAG2979421.1 hypothetical protein PC119_g21481 [Phytophthora cactorum]KAG3130989.1 hypothetical protein C6341_g23522 [Phytophthora cactorum]KAG4226825.1 hypothetical protein PC116_g24772 [Phytophthora cactorum]
MPTPPKHGLAARTRMLEAHRDGRDWVLVADHNDIPLTTARAIIERESADIKQGGGGTCDLYEVRAGDGGSPR